MVAGSIRDVSSPFRIEIDQGKIAFIAANGYPVNQAAKNFKKEGCFRRRRVSGQIPRRGSFRAKPAASLYSSRIARGQAVGYELDAWGVIRNDQKLQQG